MRKNIFFKLFLCYVIIALSMFTLLNTLGMKELRHRLSNHAQASLYDEAALISSEYMEKYYDGELMLSNLAAQLKSIDTFLNAQIWVVDREGNIILDSRANNNVINTNINDISPDFLEKTYVSKTQLGSLLTEPSMSVIYRVSSNYSIRGYIVIHYALASLQTQAILYMDIINICFLLFLIIMLLVFAYIYCITALPMQKIIHAVKEYSSGHFDCQININSTDEYRDLADAVTYMAGELNNLDDYQKKFVANISHDFRSPLTSIKGYAEAMMDGTIPAGMQDKYLGIILFETERLTKLTSNLLELNSFENNGVMLDIVSFDINHIIKKTAESFEGVCTRKKITLNLVFADKVTMVDADMSKIQQVLYNLIDNAIKFSPSNSHITVSTEEKNEKIFISVKDYGIGIPKDSIKKVWERFYKTDASRGKDKKGTGLGLSITKEIINAHNENINVISTEGVGTEFIFSLPKSEE